MGIIRWFTCPYRYKYLEEPSLDLMVHGRRDEEKGREYFEVRIIYSSSDSISLLPRVVRLSTHVSI